MPSPVAPTRAPVELPPLTLSSRPFPPRVRRLLEGVLEYATDELERGLTASLNEVEQQLFKLAEQARSNEVQQACFEALRAVKRSRPDFTPRFMIGLEAALASLNDGGNPTRSAAQGATGGELSLVEDTEMEESGLLDSIASRAEVRASLPLYLLGQRFGVLAGRPALEPESLPVGPQSLCRILRRATDCMEIAPENRLLVFRQFERHFIAFYGDFVEAINRFLAKEGVLGTLTYVPMRVRRAASIGAPPSKARPAGTTEAREVPMGGSEPGGHSPAANGHQRRSGDRPGATAAPPVHTAWPGTADSASSRAASNGQNEELFTVLRQLLAGRRELTGKLAGKAGGAGTAARSENLYVASAEDIQSVLGVLQHKPTATVLVDGQPALRSVQHVKQDLLAQLRQVAPQGKTPALSEEDTDTIDLVSMLFDFILREIRPSSPAAPLLAKLQVPLMRVAMRDKGFFTRQVHPARQMLSAIAESGAYWSEGDEGDRGTVEKMRSVVDRVVTEFDGDVDVFESLSEDLGSHLQTLARKAEVAERRHVDAAKGKEKLALARVKASDAVAKRIRGHKIPRFVHTLLTQAWTDVLALSLLRHGDESTDYRRQLEIAERLTLAASSSSDQPSALSREEAVALREEIGTSLSQVGYHAEDAKAIAARLTSVEEEAGAEDDPASRTELALRMKARSRLGGDLKQDKAAKLPPLSAEEKACYDRIRALPFGAWLEFSTNQQGEMVRRRMSWFSTVTGHALFVNARGQRVGEYTLDWLARSMARDQVRVISTERNNLIDRAWGAIVTALKGFGSTPTAARSGTSP